MQILVAIRKTLKTLINSFNLFQTDFSLNKFLKKHNRAIFDTLRDDLGSYLKSLRHSTIELINKDYEDFLNLSTDLIGLDKAINSIESPLNQLREEVIVSIMMCWRKNCQNSVQQTSQQ